MQQELIGVGQQSRDVAAVTEELAKQAARELALLGGAESAWADEWPQVDCMATLPFGPRWPSPPCPAL